MTRILEIPRNRFAEALAIAALVFVLAVICGFGQPGFAVNGSSTLEASAR